MFDDEIVVFSRSLTSNGRSGGHFCLDGTGADLGAEVLQKILRRSIFWRKIFIIFIVLIFVARHTVVLDRRRHERVELDDVKKDFRLFFKDEIADRPRHLVIKRIDVDFRELNDSWDKIFGICFVRRVVKPPRRLALQIIPDIPRGQFRDHMFLSAPFLAAFLIDRVETDPV